MENTEQECVGKIPIYRDEKPPLKDKVEYLGTYIYPVDIASGRIMFPLSITKVTGKHLHCEGTKFTYPKDNYTVSRIPRNGIMTFYFIAHEEIEAKYQLQCLLDRFHKIGTDIPLDKIKALNEVLTDILT